MTNVTTKSNSFEPATDTAAHLFDNWFDPIEIGVRERVREFIEALIRGELDAVLARPRYGRAKNDDACPAGIVGHRHGSRTRSLTGSFGKTEITVPRARLQTSEGGTIELRATRCRLSPRSRTGRACSSRTKIIGMQVLEEAGDRLFTFTQLPPSQWRSARTTNAIERLHEEFKRQIKTQTVLPSAETAAMLFWALLASGQINMRKVDGWQTLATRTIDQPIDLAA